MLKKFFLSILFCTANLFAGTQTVGHAPQNVQVQMTARGAQLSWEYNLPDEVLSYNDGIPYGIWAPRQNQALGVVFDLRAYPGATLEMIDFAHYGRELLHGPYSYRIHIFDMDSSKLIATIDSLEAKDAFDLPRYEVGVELGGVKAAAHTGIFIEGLSIYMNGSDADAFPALMSDSSAYVDSVNYYLTDVTDPWLVNDPDYTSFYETNLFTGGATNFIIDLWVNNGNGTEKVNATPPQPEAFRIFRAAAGDTLQKIAEVAGDVFLFEDQNLPGPQTYEYGVSSVLNGVVSAATTASYQQPKIYDIAEVRQDVDQDGLPDMLNENVFLRGVVSTPNLNHRTDYFLQSGEAGIRLLSTNVTSSLQPGDSVLAFGSVQVVDGTTILEPRVASDLSVYATGAADTVAIALNEVGEKYESRLVAINGLQIVNGDAWPANDEYSISVKVTNGSDTLYLVIDQDTDLDGWQAPQGTFNLVAVVEEIASAGQGDQAYFLRPRFKSDFMPATAISGEDGLQAHSFSLQQNYPNPFNPVTTISYELPAATQVRLSVFDMLGREVRVLVHAQQPAGTYRVSFNAGTLASGIYLYRLQTAQSVMIKKMILMK